MIRSVFGTQVTVLRYATVEDVKRMDPPYDAQAKKALASKSWVVIDYGPDHGRRGEQVIITHLAKLRADGGIGEILDALGDKD